jgi:hypothetical protein
MIRIKLQDDCWCDAAQIQLGIQLLVGQLDN